MSGHKEVDLVSFTGGIGRLEAYYENAANNVTNIALELGGKLKHYL